MGFPGFKLNPIARKRWMRFRAIRRAWLSLCILAAIYAVSLCAELVCNSRPLAMAWRGKLYFPVFRHYPADEFLQNGVALAADYRDLEATHEFKAGDGWMLWPVFKCDPNEQVRTVELEPYRRLTAYLLPVPGVATAAIGDDAFAILDAKGAETLVTTSGDLAGRHTLREFWDIPAEATAAVKRRFANEASPEMECRCKGKNGAPDVTLKLLAYKKRRTAPRRLVVKLTEAQAAVASRAQVMKFDASDLAPVSGRKIFDGLPADVREKILVCLRGELGRHQEEGKQDSTLQYGQNRAQGDGAEDEPVMVGPRLSLRCERERIEHPFRPVPGHWLGLDEAGRDVLARIIYGMRTSLTFGLLLVAFSLLFGTAVGCVQGYLGGWTDLLGQRFIEIWSALPFLYVIILMGSLFGTSFWLLIVCYALFNWIGVSYYMRAEMFRLRKQPFVEAARCLGLPWWLVVTRHILPNALVPLVTLLPFSLVGAIGALAGLDYLGFGLPPPTPSLGQLLQQAQEQREAWWLTAYPSLALFTIMLLCVFIGEGVREAFDPKRQNRIQA